MAPHSSTLAWKIPWTEEPGRLLEITDSIKVVSWLLEGVCVCLHIFKPEEIYIGIQICVICSSETSTWTFPLYVLRIPFLIYHSSLYFFSIF